MINLPLLYQDLSKLTEYEKFIIMNSGAEAVETAIKIVRKWAYQVKRIPRNKAEIIVADGNFHGRTITLISFRLNHYTKMILDHLLLVLFLYRSVMPRLLRMQLLRIQLAF